MSDLPIPSDSPLEDPIPEEDGPQENPIPAEFGHSQGYIAPTRANRDLLREAMLREGGNMEDSAPE